MAWDTELGPLADLVAGCAEAADRAAGPVQVHRLVVEVPMELRSDVATDGAVTVVVAPPRQSAATTVMPVLHRLRVVAEAGP